MKEAKDINALGGTGLFVAWIGHGAYTFSVNSVPNYVAEKFNIRQYMYDAEALTQLIKAKLGASTKEDWPICEDCNLPYHKKGMRSECICNMEAVP